MGIILGGGSASDLILDGKSVSLYVGGNPPIKVWPVGPRVVTLRKASITGFEKSPTGDASLIGGWHANGNENAVIFVAPVTCDTDARIVDDWGFVTVIRAGTTIPTGSRVLPGYYGTAGIPYVFTEVL